MTKIVQENFGEAIISAVGGFARSDLRTVDDLKATEFAHVSDPNLQNTLAETFYGARWIYKLGLALLVKDAEQMAHVRTQVMDYGAVCEGLLSDAILHALQMNRMQGQRYLNDGWGHPINWQVQDLLAQISKQNFFWLINVAREARIIDQNLQASLHTMRKERNTVHMRARTHRAFLGTSKALFDTVMETIQQTQTWRRQNP